MRIRQLEERAWRVGYQPEPWEWADWRWAGPGGRFTGRWDALDGGLYRTIYAGQSLFACLVELLAPLRPDPNLVVAMDQIVVDPQDEAEHPTVPAGTVDVDDWSRHRLASSARLRGRFCVVTASATIADLWPHFHTTAISVYGLEDFDAAALKNARPRELTQAVSQHLWSARSADGSDLCDGIEFLSRHGDDLVLWALFERTDDRQTSPHLTDIEHHQLNRDTPDLMQAFSFLGLRMLPPAP
ncbi:hypothetical protein [Citricoccus alkalitolerans]|uniref:RES domain-containing protein n=1 Tax=Citricoccus alkalitolerans TaxID=246603 RepID=A0ABV8Y2D0_9MICC